MATLQIKIRDGKFISINSKNIEVAESKRIKGNGWNCRINEEGEVTCNGAFYFRSKKHWVKFVLKNGFSELIVTKVGEKKTVMEIHEEIKKFPLDGTIYLPGNFSYTTIPFFRENGDLPAFLRKHGLTAFLEMDPNGKFNLTQERKGADIIYEDEVTSDGTVKLKFKRQEVGKNNLIVFAEAQVLEATWVVKTTKQNGKIVARVLYAKGNPEKIKGLPKFE